MQFSTYIAKRSKEMFFNLVCPFYKFQTLYSMNVIFSMFLKFQININMELLDINIPGIKAGDWYYNLYRRHYTGPAGPE